VNVTLLESGTTIGEGNRDLWLASRALSLGASEAASALGVCPYRSPVELWQQKTGKAPGREETEAMRWGTLLEPLILDEYERRTGEGLARRQLFVRHPGHDHLTATLDAVTAGGKLVEVKTTSAWAKGFGDEDGDELPDAYRVQLHHQFAVTGAYEADLVVLVGGQRLRIYPVERDESLVSEVVRGCTRFWGHVEAHTPPTWGWMTAQTLAVLHPECAGMVELPEETAIDVRIMEAHGEVSRAAEKDREAARLRVLTAMGGAQYGRLPDGRVVKRCRKEYPESTRTVTTKAHTSHYFRVLKGDPR
jgi:putative phage-type endonuclease